MGGHSRTWSQRLRINSKPVSIGLGSFPVVTLAEARRAALENRRAIARGHYPRNSIPTLAQASERLLAIHSANWKDSGRSEKIWRAGMRGYVLPQLGGKRVDRITTADIMSILLPHWATKRETMSRIKQRLSRIFRWAVAEGYRTDDPAGATLDAVLLRNGHSTRHFAAPRSEVAVAIATVRNSGAWPGPKSAFEFLVLTASRSGEVRLSDWQEVDLESGLWTVPADRSKTGREHNVPLVPQSPFCLSPPVHSFSPWLLACWAARAWVDTFLSSTHELRAFGSLRLEGLKAVTDPFSRRPWCFSESERT